MSASQTKKAEKAELRQQNMLKQKQRQFDAACKRLSPFQIVAVVLAAIALFCYAMPWTEIYNSDIPGVEVSVRGYSYAAASITKAYDSASSLYGDLAVPFYYYAQTYCERLAQVTLIAMIVTLLALVCQAVTAATRKFALNYIALAVNVVSAILLFVCMSVAGTMSGSDILPIYCSGNPACSIRCLAYGSAVLSLLAAAANGFILVRYQMAHKLLK